MKLGLYHISKYGTKQVFRLYHIYEYGDRWTSDYTVFQDTDLIEGSFYSIFQNTILSELITWPHWKRNWPAAGCTRTFWEKIGWPRAVRVLFEKKSAGRGLYVYFLRKNRLTVDGDRDSGKIKDLSHGKNRASEKRKGLSHGGDRPPMFHKGSARGADRPPAPSGRENWRNFAPSKQ